MTPDRLSALLQLLKEGDLSIHQWIILFKLKTGGDFMMSELAKEAGFSTAACTVSIDRLEDRGFITRKKDPSDRRKIIVSISLTGASKVNALSGA